MNELISKVGIELLGQLKIGSKSEKKAIFDIFSNFCNRDLSKTQ